MPTADETATPEIHRRIDELHQLAAELRTEASFVPLPIELARRAYDPEFWAGRRADEFQRRMDELQKRISDPGGLSARATLEDAALDCDRRAAAMASELLRLQGAGLPVTG